MGEGKGLLFAAKQSRFLAVVFFGITDLVGGAQRTLSLEVAQPSLYK